MLKGDLYMKDNVLSPYVERFHCKQGRTMLNCLQNSCDLRSWSMHGHWTHTNNYVCLYSLGLIPWLHRKFRKYFSIIIANNYVIITSTTYDVPIDSLHVHTSNII